MQNPTREIQNKPRHQMFWDDLNNPQTTQPNETYSNKFKRMIPKHQSKSSDFMEPCSDGKTILENIAEKGHSDIIEYLFENYEDIDIDKKYIGGNTLLHIAIKNKNFEMAKFLIKKGARIEILNDKNDIPLTLCSDENKDIKQLLENTHMLDYRLHQAIKDKNKDEIDKFLNQGARPNGGITRVEDLTATETQGNLLIGKFVSNISLAIEVDSEKSIIDSLMARYVKTSSNPFKSACDANNQRIFQDLLTCEINLNPRDVPKIIPNLLHMAIQSGSVDIVEICLTNKHEYDINHKFENEFNNNALQFAITTQFHFETEDQKRRGKEVIKLLIDKVMEEYPKHEEALSNVNTNGYNARFMLSNLGETGRELLEILDAKIEQKEEGDRKIRQEEYEKRLELYADIEQVKDSDPKSSNKAQIFQDLLTYEIKNHPKDVSKIISHLLHKAIQSGSVDIVKICLKNKQPEYDINHKFENESSNNALQSAIFNQYHFTTDDQKRRGKKVIELLIDKVMEEYPKHEEALSNKNNNGHDARIMLSYLRETGKELTERIDKKIREKEYASKMESNFIDLKQEREQEPDSDPKCMTALCCCMIVSFFTKGVKANQNPTTKDASPVVAKDEKKNFELTADMVFGTKTSKVSNVSTKDLNPDNATSNHIPGLSPTNQQTIEASDIPAVTPSKPSQGNSTLTAIEIVSTSKRLV